MKVIIVGGGVQGLCTAEYLSALPGTRLTLIEQYEPLHPHGSSHGHTRITRSTYADPLYVELMQYSHNVYWPEIEQRLHSRFIQPVDGCFFGPSSGTVQTYISAIEQIGANVSHLSLRQARQHFPQFKFKDDDSILFDHTSGQIFAQKLIQRLWETLKCRSVQIHANERVLHIDTDKLEVRTQHRTMNADKIVVCAGPWTASLCPELQSHIQVVQQYVSYWQPPQNMPRFPVWVGLGYAHSENWYGLPQSQNEGFKIAKHRLIGSNDPINNTNLCPTTEIDAIRQWANEHLTIQLNKPINTETCLYSVTKTEDFIIKPMTDNSDIICAAGFSGHGFKFGPLIARYIAALVTEKNTPKWFDMAQSRWGSVLS